MAKTRKNWKKEAEELRVKVSVLEKENARLRAIEEALETVGEVMFTKLAQGIIDEVVMSLE